MQNSRSDAHVVRYIFTEHTSGLRIAEIAERMQLSHGMVKKYLAQGLSHLRKRLDPDDVANFVID